MDKAKIMAVAEEMREFVSENPYSRITKWADRLTALCAEEAGAQDEITLPDGKPAGSFDAVLTAPVTGKFAEVQEPVAWVNQDWDTFNTIGLFPGCDNPIPLYAAPPSAQSLIDAATERAALQCDDIARRLFEEDKPFSDASTYAKGALLCMAEIRALIGKPLNEAKGG